MTDTLMPNLSMNYVLNTSNHWLQRYMRQYFLQTHVSCRSAYL